MLKKKIIKDLMSLREELLNSKLWNKNLKNACHTSSILVYCVLKKHDIESTIVANCKHSFNLIKVKNKDYVIDLTSTQINKNFKELEIELLETMIEKTKKTKIGKQFYVTERVSNKVFFAKGNLYDILKCDQNLDNDAYYLNEVLTRLIIIKKLNLDTLLKRDTTVDKVDKLGLQVIELLLKDIS